MCFLIYFNPVANKQENIFKAIVQEPDLIKIPSPAAQEMLNSKECESDYISIILKALFNFVKETLNQKCIHAPIAFSNSLEL